MFVTYYFNKYKPQNVFHLIILIWWIFHAGVGSCGMDTGPIMSRRNLRNPRENEIGADFKSRHLFRWFDLMPRGVSSKLLNRMTRTLLFHRDKWLGNFRALTVFYPMIYDNIFFLINRNVHEWRDFSIELESSSVIWES